MARAVVIGHFGSCVLLLLLGVSAATAGLFEHGLFVNAVQVAMSIVLIALALVRRHISCASR